MPERRIPTRPNVQSPLCYDADPDLRLDVKQVMGSGPRQPEFNKEREKHGNGD